MDGTFTSREVMLGADGNPSRVRRQLPGNLAGPHFTRSLVHGALKAVNRLVPGVACCIPGPRVQGE